MKPTQEQVIAWARKYGDWNGQTVEMNDVGLEAAYAAAYEAGRTAEREKVAAWMIQRSYATGHGDTTEDLLAELDWQIAENWNRAMINGVAEGRKDENKACAELIPPQYFELRDRIRARREQ